MTSDKEDWVEVEYCLRMNENLLGAHIDVFSLMDIINAGIRALGASNSYLYEEHYVTDSGY